jgi:hypothetical protein
MAQIDGDRRRAERAYALACDGCTTDVYRAWIAGDFGYACAVTNDVEKAVGCVDTVRRLLPTLEMKSDPTAWAAATTIATCIVLEARGAGPPWLRDCLEEVVDRLDRRRRPLPDQRFFHQAGRAALGRSGLSALEDARRASHEIWAVEQAKFGHIDGCLVAALVLERSGKADDARVAAAWAKEAVAQVEARFPAGYAGHVRELMGGVSAT